MGTNQSSLGRAPQRGSRPPPATESHPPRQPISGSGRKRGPEKGVDGNKKVKGRKRHLAVDVLGLVYGVWVSAANMADVKAAPIVIVPILDQFPRVEKVMADQGYRGARPQKIAEVYGISFELTKKLGEGFQVEPKRWIVERPFAWLVKSSR